MLTRTQIAGLSTQVVSLLLFIILGAEFAWRVRKHPDQLDERFKSLRNTKLWTMFLVGATTFRLSRGETLMQVLRSRSGYCYDLYPLCIPSCRAQFRFPWRAFQR